MGFLIRMAFWFSLVLLVLPLDPQSDSGTGDNVSPVQAFFAAREAVGDMAAICERKPDVCETGKAAMHTISVRAKESARIALDMIDEGKAKPGEFAATGTEVTGSIKVQN